MWKIKAEPTYHRLSNKKVGTLNIGKSYYSLPLDLSLQTVWLTLNRLGFLESGTAGGGGKFPPTRVTSLFEDQ